MRRSLASHKPLLLLTARRHRNRFCSGCQRAAAGGGGPAAAAATGRRARAGALFLVAVFGLALALGAIVWLCRHPVSLERANDLSVTVLDRNDRLLRAYTAGDGRWRLPIEPAEVDAR